MGEITLDISRGNLALVAGTVFVGVFLYRYGKPMFRTISGTTFKRYMQLSWLWCVPMVAVLIWDLPNNGSSALYKVLFSTSILMALVGLVGSAIWIADGHDEE